MGTQRRCNRSSTASALTLNSFKQSSSTMGAVATVTNFVLAGLVLVIKYPFWLLKYGLFPSTRSRPSWTLRNQLLVNTLRWTMDLIVDVQVPFARDLDLPPVAANELKHSHQVMLEPLEDRYLQGIITESAREVGGLERISKFPQPKGAVGPRKIPGRHMRYPFVTDRHRRGQRWWQPDAGIDALPARRACPGHARRHPPTQPMGRHDQIALGKSRELSH